MIEESYAKPFETQYVSPLMANFSPRGETNSAQDIRIHQDRKFTRAHHVYKPPTCKYILKTAHVLKRQTCAHVPLHTTCVLQIHLSRTLQLTNKSHTTLLDNGISIATDTYPIGDISRNV